MRLKEKIKNHEKLIGMHINLNDVTTARIAGLAGYDYIWVDLEHSYLSLEHLLGHILAIQSTGTAVIVRVPVDDLTYTKKVIEMGPDGIIFPMIRSAAEANRLIATTLYPPYGTRGFGPMNAVKYGFDSVADYIDNTRDNLCRFIQIEHVDAVNALEEIIQNPYIDGYIFGANDLSGSIGQLGKVFDKDTTALIRKSVRILKENGKYIGLSTGDTAEATLKHWCEMGVEMLSAGADFDFLQQRSLQTKLALEKAHKYLGTPQGRIFYTANNLTQDVHCSLKAPDVYGAASGEWDIFSAEKRKWQSAPCLCKTKSGTLYLTFSGDNFGGDEAPNNYNVIMKSTDGGISFQTVFTVAHPDSVRMHEPILWEDKSGVLHHFWAQSYNWWDGRGGVWEMEIFETENGDEHTAPRRLCDGVMATPPFTDENGDILLPVSIWKAWKDTIHPYPHWGNSAVYRSADGGKSFRYTGGADIPDTTFDENAIVARADGSLYMIARCEDRIAFVTSLDGGKTWSTPQTLMPHTGSRSYLTKLPSGNLLLVTNDDAHARKNMTAFLSLDGGISWTYKLLLDERETVSYPAGCVDGEGRVHVAYDRNRYIDEEIFYASFTEEDIKNGVFADGSFTKRLIVKGKNGQKTDKIFEDGGSV